MHLSNWSLRQLAALYDEKLGVKRLASWDTITVLEKYQNGIANYMEFKVLLDGQDETVWLKTRWK